MAGEIEIEALGDHEYLVRFPTGGEAEAIASRFHATPAVLEQVLVAGADERRIVAETAAFLAERQPVIDMPPMIDLDDVEAAYGATYLRDLNRRLS